MKTDKAQARAVALASAGATVLVLGSIALRQIGVAKRLADPPGDIFNSDEIVMSDMARPMAVPDGLLGLASYAVTMVLLANGSSMTRPKLMCDSCAAVFNTVRQILTFRKVCSWCMAVVLLTAATAVYGWNASDD